MERNMEAELIIEKLCSIGKTLVFGGFVRDLIFFGIESDDIDIITEVPENQVLKLFNEEQIKVVGKTTKVIMIGQTTIKSCDNIEQELSKSDLTINSMSMCFKTGEIFDPYGGLQDLKNRIIRFVNDPNERISEDPCRIIRACRFAAKFDFMFAVKTLKCLTANSNKVNYIDKERIRLEIMKSMKIQKASNFFHALHTINALQYIFPSIEG